MRSALRSVSFLFLATALAAPAHGAITAYADRTTFGTILQPGSYTETFDGGAGTASSYVFSGGSPSSGYTVTAFPGLVFRDGSIIGNDNAGQALAFTPTTGNVSAFGGDFYITNANGVFQAVSVTVTATDNLGSSLSQTYVPTSTGSGTFRGFATTGVFTSIVLSAPPGTAIIYNTADNVTVGRANPVPEPSALAALGLGAIALLKRRKRA